MSETPIALRVQAETLPSLPSNLVAWADTASKLLRVAAAEIESVQSNYADLQANCKRQHRENERLRNPFRAVDAQDWEFVMGALPDGGRGRFWKALLQEMRGALEQQPTEMKP